MKWSSNSSFDVTTEKENQLRQMGLPSIEKRLSQKLCFVYVQLWRSCNFDFAMYCNFWEIWREGLRRTILFESSWPVSADWPRKGKRCGCCKNCFQYFPQHRKNQATFERKDSNVVFPFLSTFSKEVIVKLFYAPTGVYSSSDTPGGLIRAGSLLKRGELIHKVKWRIYIIAFRFFTVHFADSTCNLRVKYTNSTGGGPC